MRSTSKGPSAYENFRHSSAGRNSEDGLPHLGQPLGGLPDSMIKPQTAHLHLEISSSDGGVSFSPCDASLTTPYVALHAEKSGEITVHISLECSASISIPFQDEAQRRYDKHISSFNEVYCEGS